LSDPERLIGSCLAALNRQWHEENLLRERAEAEEVGRLRKLRRQQFWQTTGKPVLIGVGVVMVLALPLLLLATLPQLEANHSCLRRCSTLHGAKASEPEPRELQALKELSPLDELRSARQPDASPEPGDALC
jgi:hypothetical protein